MSEEAKAEDLVDGLREAFSANIRDAIREIPAHQALQLADTLCTVWLERLQGMRVTHRARPLLDGVAIAEDWARGLSLVEIMRKHGCKRTAAYDYHPSKQRKQGTALG